MITLSIGSPVVSDISRAIDNARAISSGSFRRHRVAFVAMTCAGKSEPVKARTIAGVILGIDDRTRCGNGAVDSVDGVAHSSRVFCVIVGHFKFVRVPCAKLVNAFDFAERAIVVRTITEQLDGHALGFCMGFVSGEGVRSEAIGDPHISSPVSTGPSGFDEFNMIANDNIVNSDNTNVQKFFTGVLAA